MPFNKFITLLLFYSLLACQIKAQEKFDNIYALDENWKGTDIKTARYLYHVKKINDTCWQWDAYFVTGPLIRTEYYKDKEANIVHGKFYFYNISGYIDSIHEYYNGIAEGTFYYLNDTGSVYLEKKFHKGILTDSIDKLKIPPKKKEIDDGIAKKDTTEGVESMFQGKYEGWKKFLEKNLNYPERAINNRIQGTVIVQFIVDTEGKIQDPRIFKSVEFSLDEEALRIIKKSTQWIPAVQNGKKVKSYKRQPIIFRLE